MKFRGLLLLLCLGAMPALADDKKSNKVVVPEADAAPAKVAGGNPDPWEKYNRAIFRFNDRLDRFIAKPLAKGYRKVTPSRLRTGVTNFFVNLSLPVVVLNDLLQGKPRDAGTDTVRFLINSTWGVAGFIDHSARMGLPRNEEDFGQTLGKWGAAPGPYLVFPVIGPSSLRDGIGYGVDVATNPRTWIIDPEVNVGIAATYAINTRANLLEVEDIVQGDRYLFIRDLYMQRREYLVRDGKVENDPFLDDSSDEEEEGDTAPGQGGDAGDAEAEPSSEVSQAPGAGTASDNKDAADDDSF
ncbi:MAG: mlaA [Moraxellaceae bacterium]|nr:mlaA [Moraxellaceae bacterium]